MAKQAVFILRDGGSLRTQHDVELITPTALTYGSKTTLIAGNTEACQRLLEYV